LRKSVARPAYRSRPIINGEANLAVNALFLRLSTKFTLSFRYNLSFNKGTIMNKKVAVLATAMLAASLGGCATVLNGTSTDYTTTTTPDGASVKFTGGQTCTTPCSLEFKRKSDIRADITLAGYKPTYVLIQSKLGGSAFGNILLGGGVGAIVDGSNGASNRLYPRPLIVRLAPECPTRN
jgi:hypothetical protein